MKVLFKFSIPLKDSVLGDPLTRLYCTVGNGKDMIEVMENQINISILLNSIVVITVSYFILRCTVSSQVCWDKNVKHVSHTN